jgi:hypothetical protein
MWARWVLAIGLGIVLAYIGVVHGLVRQSISRSTAAGPEQIRGRRAVTAGGGIAGAGLALILLGLLTAVSWHAQPVIYGLWVVVGLGIAIFFFSLRGR